MRHSVIARRAPFRQSLFVALMLAGAGSAGLSASAAPTDSGDGEIVVRVGDGGLTASQIKDLLRSLDPKAISEIRANSKLAMSVVQREAARIALLQEAKSKNWSQRPEVAKDIERARDLVIAQSYLDASVKLPDGYPADDEARKTYDLNQQKFFLPRQYRLAELFVPAASDAPNAPEPKAQAIELAQKAKAKDFAFDSVASPSGARGGELGWIAETQLLPQIKAKVAGMQPSDVSEPLFVSAADGGTAGWHVIKLIETKAAGPLPFADAKPSIVDALRKQKLEQLRQQYVQSLLDKKSIAVNGLALDKIVQALK
jgi:parvulin-like peptidyl-prolyl isomerase